MNFGSELFPSLFSGKIAESVGLIDERPSTDPNVKVTSTYYDDIEMLRSFQNMILGGCDFKEAILGYHGKELNEEQVIALKLIEKSTKPFVVGELASVLMNKVKKGDGRFVVDAAEILLNEMINQKEGGMTTSRARQLIVNLKG